MSYHEIMPEVSGEDLSHKDKIKLARAGISRKRDERQIRLSQEANRRDRALPSGKLPLISKSETTNTDQLEAGIIHGLIEVASEYEFADITANTEALTKLRGKIAPLITNETKLLDLDLPELKTARHNPAYDKETVDRFSRIIGLKSMQTRVINNLRRKGLVTVGDMQTKSVHELASMRDIGLKSAVYIKTVYMPLPSAE